MCGQLLSRVRLFVTTWAVARQSPLSMQFSRQEYWSMLPFPPPGDLPNPGIEPTSLVVPVLAGGFFTTEPPGKPCYDTSIWNFLELPHEVFWGDYAPLNAKRYGDIPGRNFIQLTSTRMKPIHSTLGGAFRLGPEETCGTMWVNLSFCESIMLSGFNLYMSHAQMLLSDAQELSQLT